MLETSNILVNKLTLTIRKSSNVREQRSITDIVKALIYHQVCKCLETHIEWRSFIWGGSFSSSDNIINGIASSTNDADGHSVWAANLYVKDRYMSRRRWKYYFGIQQHSDDELSLSYAKCYYDHMAGSINRPKPLHFNRDQIPDAFFFDPSIQCMCGKQPYPCLALELNGTTLPDFVDSVQDVIRTEPIILITCADYITPELLMDQLMGNAVIYWCDDASMISRLNATLPEDMSTPWDCVHIFIPLSSHAVYHPIYTYDDIYRMGKQEFISGLIQAYCRSMHHDERKKFITIEDVNNIRNQVLISRLIEQKQSSEDRIAELTVQLRQQSMIAQEANEALEHYKHNSNETTIAEYEALLTDVMTEADNLKQGISALSEKLFSTMGIGFKPDDAPQIALFQELSQAIYSALACAASRNNHSSSLK